MYINFEKLVFVVTNACPGRCAHCQVSSGAGRVKGALDPNRAAQALRQLAERHPIRSVMMFGGEPMLYPETVFALLDEAARLGIEGRGMITNGFVRADRNAETARAAAERLAQTSPTSVLVSADVFHEVNIPFQPVYAFVAQLMRSGINVQLHPAWISGEAGDNPYDEGTRRVLARFADLNVPISTGNIIFPSGNAALLLEKYAPAPDAKDFEPFRCGKAPYTSPLDDVREVHIEPDGSVKVCEFVIGNILRENLAGIAERYDPYANADMRLLMEGGPYALYKRRLKENIPVDAQGVHSACELCQRICSAAR